MKEVHPISCVNCGAPVTAAFCSSCGQRAGVKRITLRDSLRDWWAQVYGLDGIFLRTLRDLTIRPGQVARDHINGIRVKYFGPIGYFFFMITLLLLWLSILNLDFAELIQSKQRSMQIAKGSERAIAVMTGWIASNIKWVLFLAVPFQAFAARFLFFRKSGLNLVEHTVPLFYVTGHLFWLSMLTFGYRSITGDLPSTFVSVLSILYFGFMYASLCTYQSRVKAFIKGMGVYIGGQFLFALVMVVIVVIAVLLLGYFYPQALESLRPLKS